MNNNNNNNTDWITQYETLLAGELYPAQYNHFIAVSLLSSAINRNCWIDFGFYNVYPNVCIFLIDRSELSSNLPAIVHGIELLTTGNIPIPLYSKNLVVSDIVAYMFDTRVACKYDDAVFYKTPCLLYGYDIELLYGGGGKRIDKIGNILNFMNILYSNQDEYVYYNREDKTQTILENPFLNVLLGCNKEQFIKQILPKIKYSKYIRRNILFIESTSSVEHYTIHPSEYLKQLKQELISELVTISNLYGPLLIREDARRKLNAFLQEEGARGYSNLLKRLVIIYSLSRSRNGIIELEDVERTRAILQSVINTSTVFEVSSSREPSDELPHL